MMRILSEILVTLSASPAISLAAKGTVVLALGLVSAWFARRSRAAVRHALLASTFGVLLALPIVSLLATPVPIAVPVARGDSNIWPLFDNVSVPSSGQPEAGGFGAATAKSGFTLPPRATMLLCAWFLGTAFFMIPIVRGLLQIRSLRRFGLPWRHAQGARRQIEVLLHESLPGPMTCGVLNPVIILPADAQSWDKQDLERALVHELEHVRRYDWPIHCLARVACAAYWFHPLVWIAWRQLKLEAERSCDDAVLGSSEATAYADQLVGLARRRSVAGKSPVLAMAGRSDLAARVGALLDVRQRRGPIGTSLVAAACIGAAAIVLTMSPLRMVAAPQPAVPAATDGKQLVFDAASIKPNITGGEICTRVAFSCILNLGQPGRITIINQPLRELIGSAYRLTAAQTRAISGAPKWMDSERFDIQATAEDNPDLEQKCMMLRSLLADRFGLAVHHETRQGPVYALVLAKAAKVGPGLVRHAGDAACIDFSKPHPPSLGDSICGGFLVLSRAGVTHVTANNTNMGGMADQLGGGMPGGEIERPVVDRTGLSGSFDVTLEYTPDLKTDRGGGAPDLIAPPPLITALQDQLGLKLEPQTGPVDVLVIDHVARPSEN